MGYIYKITNKINNKIYIGLTSKTPEARWQQHIKTSRSPSSKDYNELFKKAIRKYGPDNFIIETIDETEDFEELKEKEKYYIKKYNSFAFAEGGWGYNSTLSGDGALGYVAKPICKCDVVTGEILKTYNTIYEATTKEQLRIKNAIENYNHASDGGRYCYLYKTTVDKLTEEERINYIHSLNPTLVYCLDLNGEIVKIYLNSKEANKAIGNNSVGNITSCCLGKRRICAGYQWAYQRDLKERLHKPVRDINQFKIPVTQYGLNGKKIKDWQSQREASQTLNISDAHIASCCHLKRRVAGGYQWRFTSEKIEQLGEIYTKRPVVCVQDGREYPTPYDAAKAYGYSQQTIKRSCCGYKILKPLSFKWKD